MGEIDLELVFADGEASKVLLDRRYGLGDGTARLEGAAGAVELRLRPAPVKNGRLDITASGQAFAMVLPYVTALATPLAAALGAWLKERYGRKVRLKVGDVEAEASTAEEVEKLLAKAQELKRMDEPNRILP